MEDHQRFTVLVAEDDDDDCLLAKLAFQEISVMHDLHFVRDGRELLDYLKTDVWSGAKGGLHRPNLILLDLNMPRIDGRESLKIMKSDPGLKDIPVLILTTSTNEPDIALAREIGASSYLVKPDTLEAWIDMLSLFCTAIRKNPDIPFQVIGL